ncbi:hypothetical protein GcC1_132020, partial [Golovinomyces cichoracearum]
LDDYFRRNYTSRQVLAISEQAQANGIRASDKFISGKLNADKVSLEAVPSKSKNSFPSGSGNSIDLETKATPKEQLREQGRREGRCYYSHHKGHLTNLCQKKLSRTVKNIEETKIIAMQNTSLRPPEFSDSENQ